VDELIDEIPVTDADAELDEESVDSLPAPVEEAEPVEVAAAEPETDNG
jgi:hypothetical protein